MENKMGGIGIQLTQAKEKTGISMSRLHGWDELPFGLHFGPELFMGVRES